MEVVTNGEEAVAAVKEKQFDFVFMDCQMPVLDGFQASKIICDTTPRANRPIIIALTAHALKGDQKKCLEAGMDDYVAKPFSKDALQEIISKYGKKMVA